MMQISNNLHVAQQAQTQALKNNSSNEGSPAEEASESAAERVSEAQKKAVAQSTGVGTQVDFTA